MRLTPLLEAVEDFLEEAEDAPLGDAVDRSDRPRRLDDRLRGVIEYQDREVGFQGGRPRLERSIEWDQDAQRVTGKDMHGSGRVRLLDPSPRGDGDDKGSTIAWEIAPDSARLRPRGREPRKPGPGRPRQDVEAHPERAGFRLRAEGHAEHPVAAAPVRRLAPSRRRVPRADLGGLRHPRFPVRLRRDTARTPHPLPHPRLAATGARTARSTTPSSSCTGRPAAAPTSSGPSSRANSSARVNRWTRIDTS